MKWFRTERDLAPLVRIVEQEPSIGVVEWQDSECGFGIRTITEGFDRYKDGQFLEACFYDGMGRCFSWDRLEVIGNIYENPGLLEIAE